MRKAKWCLWARKTVLALYIAILGVLFLPGAAFALEPDRKPETAMDFLVRNWKNRVEAMDLTGYKVTQDDLSAISFRAQKLYPELYYLERKEYYQDSEGYITELTMIYGPDRDTELEAETKKVLALINDSMSDLEKAMVVHDYMCMDITYSKVDLSAHDIRGAILKKKAVCEGYAEAYKYYMDRIGIPCNVISGQAPVGGTHAWNQIQIDGKWYLIDATWDDTGTKRGDVSHQYFLCSREKFSDYKWNENAYEICDDTTYDNAFWRNFNKAVFADNGSMCYVSEEGIYRHDLKDDSIQDRGSLMIPMTDVDSDYWHIYPGSVQAGYSSLACKDRLLYYSTPKAVYSCEFDGSNRTVVFALEDSDEEIWEIQICGAALYYYTASGLYEDRKVHSYVIDSDYQKAEYPFSIQSSSMEVFCREGVQLNVYAPGKLTYTSDNPEICAVDAYGGIYPESCGDVNITVQAEGTDWYLPGKTVISVKVLPKDISSGYLTLSDYQFTYNGKEHRPDVTVKRVNGLTEKDYTVSYENNIRPGTATVVVTAHGEKYTGTLSATFRIEKGSEIETEEETETETEAETETETETETEEETETEAETETETETETEAETETETEAQPASETQPETSAESDNLQQTEEDVPLQTVSVKKPAKVRIVSAKASGKQRIKIRWRRRSCSGYEIKISGKRNFKKPVRTVLVKGKKRNTKVISKLKSGTVYYVRIRACKKVKGKLYYGAYSQIKKVRTR